MVAHAPLCLKTLPAVKGTPLLWHTCRRFVFTHGHQWWKKEFWSTSDEAADNVVHNPEGTHIELEEPALTSSQEQADVHERIDSPKNELAPVGAAPSQTKVGVTVNSDEQEKSNETRL